MDENFKLGMDCKLYFDTTPVTDSTEAQYGGITTELDTVKDVTLNLETGEADITTRGNKGWRATAATLKAGSVDFEILWKPGDAGFQAFRDAWKDSAEIAVAILDGPHDAEGSQGLAGNFTVTNFSRNEPLEEAVTASVTVKPSSHNDWYTVPAAP